MIRVDRIPIEGREGVEERREVEETKKERDDEVELSKTPKSQSFKARTSKLTKEAEALRRLGFPQLAASKQQAARSTHFSSEDAGTRRLSLFLFF